jgi:hypothetical protein
MRVSSGIFVRGLSNTLRRNGSALTRLSLKWAGDIFVAGLLVFVSLHPEKHLSLIYLRNETLNSSLNAEAISINARMVTIPHRMYRCKVFYLRCNKEEQRQALTLS